MNDVVDKEFVQIVDAIEQDLLGKRYQIALCLCAFFARGHVLLEDMPGTGKTTLAKSLSATLGLEFARIQFTSDLLPSDILGVSYFNQKTSSFELKKGAIFTQFLLCDEINRSMPKTQSALLEAMEEHAVTIDANTYRLKEPFFVIGTQNPYEEIGVFALPLSQLDRFICSFSIGYPNKEAERMVLKRVNRHIKINPLPSGQIDEVFKRVERVHFSETLLDHIQEIIAYTRESGKFHYGLSMRGAIALRDMSASWATLQGRDYATPDDIRSICESVLSHRLQPKDRSLQSKQICDDIFTQINTNI